MQSLKSSYAEALPEKIEKLRLLWQQQNAEELRKAAHKLRGSGESYGFPEISNLCAQLETAVELTDWAEVAQILSNLDDVIKSK